MRVLHGLLVILALVMARQVLSDSADVDDVLSAISVGAKDAPLKGVVYFSVGCRPSTEFIDKALPALKQDFLLSNNLRLTFVPVPLTSSRCDRENVDAVICSGKLGDIWSGVVRSVKYGRAGKECTESPLLAANAELRRCVAELTDRVRNAVDSLAVRDGIYEEGTPTFIVNGRSVAAGDDPTLATKQLRELLAQAKESTGAARGDHSEAAINEREERERN